MHGALAHMALKRFTNTGSNITMIVTIKVIMVMTMITVMMGDDG